MAQISTVAAMLLAYALAAMVATVSAQAPAPAPDAGGAVSLPLPAAVIVSSLLFSAGVALLRH